MIRRIRPEDWQELRTVRLAALADTPDAFLTSHEEAVAYPEKVWRERSLDGSAGHGQATFLLWDGARVCGMVTGLAGRDDDVLLVGMWIHPRYRRVGHGRRMVAQLVAWAREGGAESVTLGVTEGNKAAQALYLSCGFTPTGEVKTYAERRHLTEHVMRLQLPA